MNNINNKEYWEQRFESGDWVKKGGSFQTRSFAKSYLRFIDLQSSFSGTILDFGCGTGEAIPVLHKKFPNAGLIGIDFSSKAIEKCVRNFGYLAKFICGTYLDVPEVDVIIASNILEHLTDDKNIAQSLLSKCSYFYVLVPYMENLSEGNEHVNCYGKDSFNELNPYLIRVIRSRGWSEKGFDLFYNVYFKNFIKLILGHPRRRPRRQILFGFRKGKIRKP